MKHRARTCLIPLITIIAFTFAVSTASARRLENSTQLDRIVWSFLRFADAGGGLAIECPITLEGSFHSKTYSKISGALVGAITRAAVGAFAVCRNRENVENVTILQNTLPWHIRYDSFTGPLPNITNIRLQIIGFGFLLSAFGTSCLYKSTAARPATSQTRREAGGILTDMVPDVGSAIPLFEGGFLCPANGVFTNGVGVTASITWLGSATTKIRLSLVQ